MFVLINRKHLSYFAKSICIKLQKRFVLICRKCLYYLAKCICISLQKVFLQIAKIVWIFFQKVFALVCKKYFPFSREASCMLCNAGCQDLPCGKTSESRDCLFDTLTPSFPPELWYKNFLNISHSLLLWILHIIHREVRILHLLNCIYWICC